MIEKKLDEAGKEANTKGYCDKATSDAQQKLEYASDDMVDLNGRMARQSALSEQMAEDIAELTAALAKLNTMVSEANANRAKEQASNAQTVTDAKAGKKAVEDAIKVLNVFYGTARNAAAKIAAPEEDLDQFKATQKNDQARATIAADCKEKCSGNIAASTTCVGGMDKCVSDATAKVDKADHVAASKAKVAARMEAAGQDADIDEASAGSGAAAGGIIAMMEVIQSDFARTISKTESSEEEAVDEHRDFLTASGSSFAEKKIATGEKTKLKNEADGKVSADEGTLGTRSGVAVAGIRELKALKAKCQPKGQSYEERVAKREDEIASMNKGLCILDAREC